MSESWRSRLARWQFNLFPAYRGTGGRVLYIRHDWREVLGADADLVVGLGHIPQFKIENGRATPDPVTLAGARG